MAVASVVPIVWGVATGHIHEAEWMTLTAESIAWVELRGSGGLRFRVLIGGTLLALFFGFIGSITGTSIWLSVICMMAVAFLSSLFRNLGDRGSGLAICVYLMFIISNAFPVSGVALQHRILYILIGGVWNAVVGMAASAFIPEQEPYRRTIAIIWKSIASLTTVVSKGWNGNDTRSSLREVYLKEKEVRSSIDNSFLFHEKMAHQISAKEGKEYQLAQTRKATALVAAHIIAMSEELENLNSAAIDNNVRLKLYALFKAMQQTADRMAAYVLHLKPEDELLLTTRINRLNKLIDRLRAYPLRDGKEKQTILRVAQLTERSIKLIERSMTRLEGLGTELPVYRSYSLLKTVYVLHPKHLWRNLLLLFNLNSLMFRFSVRTALAAGLALFVYQWFDIERGYWIPFTVLIVIQPYFGATFKKAIDRMAGTVIGGIVGGLISALPRALHLKEFVLFICAIFMVYFLRKRYSIAAFFITVSLVLLFAVEGEFNFNLLVIRALSTLGGALLAVLAGFALLPAWDNKYLPRYLSDALNGNYEYFKHSFFVRSKQHPWTRYKRIAETRNGNVFDSYNRFLDEIRATADLSDLYFEVISHNVRLTRELNNIHLEEESKNEIQKSKEPNATQQEKITRCLDLLNQCMAAADNVSPVKNMKPVLPGGNVIISCLTAHQEIYVDKMTIELQSMLEELTTLKDRANAA